VQPVNDGLDLAPSDIALASNEPALIQRIGWDRILYKVLEKVTGYDLALIDCPPSLGVLTINALATARAVIVPSLPSAADMRGVKMFLDSLDRMQSDGLNPDLELLGILLTQFDGRTIAHQQAQEAIQGADLSLLGIIPRAIAVQEAGTALKSIIDYDRNSKPAQAYFEAAERLEKWLRNQN